MPMNKIALIGPKHLTEQEGEKVRSILQEIIENTHVTIFAYRSIETLIVRFFLTLQDAYASQLTIHLPSTLHSLEESDPPLYEAIKYLSSCGALVKEYESLPDPLTRTQYLTIWQSILTDQDELLSFYPGAPEEQPKLLSPLRIAEEMGKNAYLCRLDDQENHPLKQKIEVVKTIIP